jgi:hypothetical protein
MKTLNTIEEILADIAAGKMVVIMDDEDRENEGDLLMAAEKVRAEDINFMARFGRGRSWSARRIANTARTSRCRSRRRRASRPASPRMIARRPCAPR